MGIEWDEGAEAGRDSVCEAGSYWGFVEAQGCVLSFFFFFQAEDGIRDVAVTGVQTCALPILPSAVKPSPPAPGTWYLVYFYGNGMCLETCSYEFAQFRQLGYTVLIPEYPGYGMSSGWASESGCYEAADAAYHYLTEILHAHPAQIVVAGWSLGAAVAIDLAARKQLAGLIVLGAFTNIPEQAHAMLPWVPKRVVRLFIRERFDNLSKIRQVTCPIFIGHGTEDELVPFAMAERLAQAARPRRPVTFLPIQECSHNGIFEASSGCVWTAIKDFLSNL